jgi:hypothetical protein
MTPKPTPTSTPPNRGVIDDIECPIMKRDPAGASTVRM